MAHTCGNTSHACVLSTSSQHHLKHAHLQPFAPSGTGAVHAKPTTCQLAHDASHTLSNNRASKTCCHHGVRTPTRPTPTTLAKYAGPALGLMICTQSAVSNAQNLHLARDRRQRDPLVKTFPTACLPPQTTKCGQRYDHLYHLLKRFSLGITPTPKPTPTQG